MAAQSLHTNGYDEALNLPAEAVAIALHTQQIVAFESAGANTAVLSPEVILLRELPMEVAGVTWSRSAKLRAWVKA